MKKTWDLEALGLIPMAEYNYNNYEKDILAEFEDKTYKLEDLAKLPYFCYGSNLWKKQMKSRCPDSVELIRATLEDYKLIFRVVADITKRKGLEVPGALYKLSENDIKKLNRFEGFPYKYTIKIGRVKTAGNKTVLCFWYEIKNKRSHKTREPSVDYLAKIVLGYSQWKLKDEPILEAVKRVQNSVRQRKRKEILQKVEKAKERYVQLRVPGV